MAHHAAAKQLEVISNILEFPNDARDAGLEAKKFSDFLDLLKEITDACGRGLHDTAPEEGEFELFRLVISVPQP